MILNEPGHMSISSRTDGRQRLSAAQPLSLSLSLFSCQRAVFWRFELSTGRGAWRELGRIGNPVALLRNILCFCFGFLFLVSLINFGVSNHRTVCTTRKFSHQMA